MIKASTNTMSSEIEVLRVTQDSDFGTLMRVAEGMSYNHRVFEICARGKNIQKGFEIVRMLMRRKRVHNVHHHYTDVPYNGRDIFQLQWIIVTNTQ